MKQVFIAVGLAFLMTGNCYAGSKHEHQAEQHANVGKPGQKRYLARLSSCSAASAMIGNVNYCLRR